MNEIVGIQAMISALLLGGNHVIRRAYDLGQVADFITIIINGLEGLDLCHFRNNNRFAMNWKSKSEISGNTVLVAPATPAVARGGLGIHGFRFRFAGLGRRRGLPLVVGFIKTTPLENDPGATPDQPL
jgi:hypothetical protein